MKKTIQSAILMMAFLPAICFAQAKKATWPEMKKFHSFMAATFHPAEEGNLAPLKAKADSLYITAQLWQASAIPSNFKPEETAKTLAKLVKQCANIKKAVGGNLADSALKAMITEAHEIFHTIVGECRKADD